MAYNSPPRSSYLLSVDAYPTPKTYTRSPEGWPQYYYPSSNLLPYQQQPPDRCQSPFSTRRAYRYAFSNPPVNPDAGFTAPPRNPWLHVEPPPRPQSADPHTMMYHRFPRHLAVHTTPRPEQERPRTPRPKQPRVHELRDLEDPAPHKRRSESARRHGSPSRSPKPVVVHMEGGDDDEHSKRESRQLRQRAMSDSVHGGRGVRFDPKVLVRRYHT